jgi:hypothetical protein
MMKQRARYFDSGGREINEHEALDSSGVLRSGFSLRVPTMMRDAALSGTRNRITDGRSEDPMALHRPGFRIPVVNDRRAVRDAYAKYETSLVNAYRIGDGEAQCPDCDGSGEDDDGEICATCHGRGTVSARERSTGEGFGNEGHRSEDSRSVTRDQAYKDYDLALSSAWQNGRTG